MIILSTQSVLAILAKLSSSAHLGEHGPLEALQEGCRQQGEGLDTLASEARPGEERGEGRLVHWYTDTDLATVSW